MAQKLPKKPGVKLEYLCFYFDAVERDRLEAAGTARKSGEVLALRERLLKLPDPQFDAAIKTLRTFVDDAARGDDGEQGANGGKNRRSGARQLYDQASRAASSSRASVGKVSPA